MHASSTTTPAGPRRDVAGARLAARRAGIDTYQEAVVYMRADCPVCRAEGFRSQARVELAAGDRVLIATVHQVTADWVRHGEAALSEAAWLALAVHEGQPLAVRHPPVLESLRHIRSKAWGVPLGYEALLAIMRDVAGNRLSDLHLASFVTACAGGRMSEAETIALTRAITSPAGTADTMEVLAPVDLDLPAMRRVVEREGGCVVWGGAVQLSPADDVLIRVERPLELDSTAQMVASVLSKKASAGSERVLIDIPVGATAKVRSAAAAQALSDALTGAARAVGLQLRVVQTDAAQPVGRGIGPALEARDVLAVLQCAPAAPADLRERALLLAGHVLEMGEVAAPGQGLALARATLDSGRAWTKFQAICRAQGGLREPPQAPFTAACVAGHGGVVTAIDNRRIAMAAKLAGAPAAPAAGVHMEARLGDRVARGQSLFHLHAQSAGELAYAQAYVAGQEDPVRVEEAAP